MNNKSLAVLMTLSLALAAYAQDKKEEDKKDDKPAATAPAPADKAGEIVEATDIDKLKAAAGKTVTVHGKVSQVFKASSGRILINFEGAGRAFSGMITKDNAEAVNKGFEGDVATLKDKTINLTGTVTLFKENPQIEITKPEQITTADEYK